MPSWPGSIHIAGFPDWSLAFRRPQPRIPQISFAVAVAVKVCRQPTDSEVMDNADSTQVDDTIRIRRPPRVMTDVRGGTVWMGEVTPCALALDSGEVANCNDSTNVFHWRSPVAPSEACRTVARP